MCILITAPWYTAVWCSLSFPATVRFPYLSTLVQWSCFFFHSLSFFFFPHPHLKILWFWPEHVPAKNTHLLGQNGLAASQPLLGNNPADCRAGERRQWTKAMADITAIAAGEMRWRYRWDLDKDWLRREHLHLDWMRSKVETSWALGVQKKLEFIVWSKEGRSRGELGLLGISPPRCMAKICPSCIFCPPHWHFHKLSSAQLPGEEPGWRFWTCINSKYRNWTVKSHMVKQRNSSFEHECS